MTGQVARATEPGWTVLEVLRWTTAYFEDNSLDAPRLDAEVLLAHALRTDRVVVYLAHDRPLDPTERTTYRHLVRRRAHGQPVAYLVGRKEFYGLDFLVDPRVLVPRPETECVVDQALACLGSAPTDRPWVAVDVGTGSGAIACALAHERSELSVVATDVDRAAADLAAENVRRLVPEGRIAVIVADLRTPVAPNSADLIVANPPYVVPGDTELHPHVAAHEPARALYGGSDGLAVYRRLMPAAHRVLRPGGRVVLELGAGQHEAVRAMAQASKLSDIEVHRDLAGHPRVFLATKQVAL